MKTFLAGAVALSLLGGTMASAQPYHNDQRRDARYDQRHDTRADQRHDNGRHQAKGHRWNRGDRLPSNYRTRAHYVDYRKHHLRQPPRGYQWVQADNNYALIALSTGLIASIIAGN